MNWERVYTAVMRRVYSRDLNDKFGDELVGFARQRAGEPRYSGIFGRLRLFAHLTFDLIRNGDPMDALLQDLRFAVRSMIRRPGFAAVAIITLALGIGANSAIFSVVNAALLRPLPYPEPERLVAVWGKAGTQGQQGVIFPDFLEWREQNKTFTDIGVYRGQSITMTGGDTPQRLSGCFISASMLAVVGATVERGRLFNDGETAAGTAHGVAIVSYEAWKVRFGGDSTLLGRTINLNGAPFVVVGITTPLMSFPLGLPDVFMPITFYPNSGGLARGNRGMFAVGRLKPGVSVASAQADLVAIAKTQEQLYPATNKDAGVELQALTDWIVGPSRQPVTLLAGAVLMVLLIACANVANLQLSRGASRIHEVTVRTALGADRSRIARQLLTESVVLSLTGGVAGIGVAWAGTRWLATSAGNLFATNATIGVSGTVVAFTFGLAAFVGILFGLIPAWKVSRANPYNALRTRGAGALSRRTRGALAVAQLALSLTVLACAGLLTRSLLALQNVDPGFDTSRLITAQFRLPNSKYNTPEKISEMFRQTAIELRTVPGVKSAALARAFPLTGNGESFPVAAADKAEEMALAAAGTSGLPQMQLNSITPQYFQTMAIRLVDGRDFTDADRSGAEFAIVVNQAYAARTWPGQSAIGKRVSISGHTWTVVGVAGNTRHFRLNEQQLLQGYVPHAQRPQIFTTIAVRASGNPTLAQDLRKAIWRVDKDQPVWGMVTADALMNAGASGARFMMTLISSFAVLALVLAGIGLYGVLSYSTAQRAREMGIRMALGAHRYNIVRMVVREGMWMVGIAIVVGLAGSVLAVKLVRSQLYGVGAGDPVTFGGVTGLLAIVALVACWIPARRASRVDPVEAMRGE